jgi:signal transduction histidine kinase
MASEREQELERQLHQARDQVERFMYLASHDLKAPVRAIKSLVEWIIEDLDGVEVGADVSEHLSKLTTRIDRLDGMLSGLLELSRVTRKHGEVERVDTAALVTRVWEGLEADGFALEMDDDMPTLDTSRHWFGRLFEVILDNAVRHHDKAGGRVMVRARALDDGRLRFEVEDDGPGIAPKFHDKALEMFQTLGKSRCGIGLALAKAIVDHNGGSLSLASAGRGLTLQIDLVPGWPAAAV